MEVQPDGEPAIVSLMESVAASFPEVEFCDEVELCYDVKVNRDFWTTDGGFRVSCTCLRSKEFCQQGRRVG